MAREKQDEREEEPQVDFIRDSEDDQESDDDSDSSVSLDHDEDPAAPDTEEAKKVTEWYQRLRPLKVDIVGDFAGKELFLVHGESMMRYCLSQANVDFQGASQS